MSEWPKRPSGDLTVDWYGADRPPVGTYKPGDMWNGTVVLGETQADDQPVEARWWVPISRPSESVR